MKSGEPSPAPSSGIRDGASDLDLSRERIAATHEVIRSHIRRTPTVQVDGADLGFPGVGFTFKLEYLQRAGSFKTRGAFANLLLRQVPAAGVVAASGGNHGAAVAYAARTLGIPAAIFVPRISSAAKIEAIRSCGAELVVGGDSYADAFAASEVYADRTGALPIHAFDQVETILGQGTLALELESEHPELDTILVGVGGGGLIAGIAAWAGGRTRVVGVEPEGAPTLTRALAAGRPVDAPVGSVAADSLAPRRVGERVFPLARRWVDRVALVTDAAIRESQLRLWRVLRVVVEPGAAAATAAVLSGQYQPRPGERIAIVLSGANTTAVQFG